MEDMQADSEQLWKERRKNLVKVRRNDQRTRTSEWWLFAYQVLTLYRNLSKGRALADMQLLSKLQALVKKKSAKTEDNGISLESGGA